MEFKLRFREYPRFVFEEEQKLYHDFKPIVALEACISIFPELEGPSILQHLIACLITSTLQMRNLCQMTFEVSMPDSVLVPLHIGIFLHFKNESHRRC
jgi:hypothetical protein